MKYFCCDERRRNAVDDHPTLNGIDFLEVLDNDAPAGSPPQRTLLVRCLKALPALRADNVRIQGGERITPVGVEWAFPAPTVPAALINAGEAALLAALTDADHVLVVRTDCTGDFSRYRLVLVDSASDDLPPDDFDPLLSRIEFSFKVECPTEFDCQAPRVCPPEVEREPEINYLANDYASFRQLMLDRLTTTVPQWRDRNPADLGVALVELLAYVGDRLSYQQDAVATEAYLATARRRVSVRRHARLVDYLMHEGSNARAWVHVEVDSDLVQAVPAALPRGTPLLSRIPKQSVLVDNDAELLAKADVVFETMHDVNALFADHNELPFYTWGDRECCLPKGATRATLRGHFPNLAAGDVLIFEEVKGPLSDQAADADPTKRHPVRLSEAVAVANGGPLVDPLTGQEITDIRWGDEDALPFPLCVSSRTDEAHGEDFVEDVSVARGNIVLADHGRTIAEELDTVPEPTLFLAPTASEDRCDPAERVPFPPRFRPKLKERPLTHAARYDASGSAADATRWRAGDVVPEIQLTAQLNGATGTWMPRRDLLNSDAMATEFVVEVENAGTSTLRFGDDHHGARPEPGTSFSADYRVGNGTVGNIGADTLVHVASNQSAIVGVRNPLPARGGSEPETIEDVRQRAPVAFRTQERAVTPDDYAEVTQRDRNVQRAATTFRWTGSWHTAFVTVDRRGGLPVDQDFEMALRGRLQRYRMAGYDLEVDGPRFVPLEIDMFVCVKPDYFRSHVRAPLRDVMSNRDLPDGRRGVFHPDNFTFGRTVYLSPIYAAAHAVPGVESVRITTFQRQGTPDSKPLADRKIELHRLEIARLDHDPNFPERGVFRLTLGGGK
jgi:hypothetical protein